MLRCKPVCLKHGFLCLSCAFVFYNTYQTVTFITVVKRCLGNNPLNYRIFSSATSYDLIPEVSGDHVKAQDKSLKSSLVIDDKTLRPSNDHKLINYFVEIAYH